MGSQHEKLTNVYYRLRTIVPYIIFLLLVLLSSCGLPGMSNGRASTPVPTETPIVSTHQPFRTFRACLDITGSYPPNFWQGAENLLASSIDKSVLPDSEGMTGYIGWIAQSSWNADAMVIQVPAVAADPVYKDPADSGSIYQNGEDQTNAQLDYQNQLHQNHLNWHAVQRQVTSQTNKLRVLRPQVNPDGSTVSPNGTSVYGCISRGSLQLQGVQAQGDRYLFISSDLEENEYTENIPNISLTGVKVRVIYYHCSSAYPGALCEQKTAFWLHQFKLLGATDIQFFDYQQSIVIQNLFS